MATNLSYGTNVPASQMAENLANISKTNTGVKYWSDLLGKSSLAYQGASDILKEDYSKAIASAYKSNLEQQSGIAGMGYNAGTTGQLMNLSRQDLMNTYDTYLSKYKENLANVTETYGQQVSGIQETLMGLGQNYADVVNLAPEWIKYASSINKLDRELTDTEKAALNNPEYTQIDYNKILEYKSWLDGNPDAKKKVKKEKLTELGLGKDVFGDNYYKNVTNYLKALAEGKSELEAQEKLGTTDRGHFFVDTRNNINYLRDKGLDWLYDETGTLLTDDKIKSMMYNEDNTLTDRGRQLLDAMLNSVDENLDKINAPESTWDVLGFENWLSGEGEGLGNRADLAEFLGGADPTNYTRAGNTFGTLKQMLGLESDVYRYDKFDYANDVGEFGNIIEGLSDINSYFENIKDLDYDVEKMTLDMYNTEVDEWNANIDSQIAEVQAEWDSKKASGEPYILGQYENRIKKLKSQKKSYGNEYDTSILDPISANERTEGAYGGDYIYSKAINKTLKELPDYQTKITNTYNDIVKRLKETLGSRYNDFIKQYGTDFEKVYSEISAFNTSKRKYGSKDKLDWDKLVADGKFLQSLSSGGSRDFTALVSQLLNNANKYIAENKRSISGY